MSFLTPIVTTKNGEVYANSRDVAEFFGKEHKHVLRDINAIQEGMSKSGPTPSNWFIQTTIQNPQNGQTYFTWDMTRDGFTLLVMGYTGPKAMQFKVRYIQRFSEMEKALKEFHHHRLQRTPPPGHRSG